MLRSVAEDFTKLRSVELSFLEESYEAGRIRRLEIPDWAVKDNGERGEEGFEVSEGKRYRKGVVCIRYTGNRAREALIVVAENFTQC